MDKITNEKEYVLRNDILIQPVSDLPDELATRLVYDATDFIISTRSGRSTSKLISKEIAEFLEQFKKPIRLVVGVYRFVKDKNIDPNQFLKDAFPILNDLLRNKLLLESNFFNTQSREPIYNKSALINGRYEVISCLQNYEDCETYKAKDLSSNELVVVKIANVPTLGNSLIAKEESFYKEIKSKHIPAFIDSGQFENRRFLVIEYFTSVTIREHFNNLELRPFNVFSNSVRAILNVLSAYVDLHSQGFVHGDVHAKNILIDPDSSLVKLVDFGLVESLDSTQEDVTRAGVIYYHEPELAQAMLIGQELPRASILGEQYSLAALLYELISGEGYLDFPLEKKRILKAIVEDQPIPITDKMPNIPSKLASTLQRALSKKPHNRFANLTQFRGALESINTHSFNSFDQIRSHIASASLSNSHEEQIINTILGKYTPNDGTDIESLSFAQGTVGMAYYFYSLGIMYDEPEYLSMAYCWSLKSFKKNEEDGTLELPHQDFIPTSLHYGIAGVVLVHCLICMQLGAIDEALQISDIYHELPSVDYFQKEPFYDFNYGEIGMLLGYIYILENPQLSTDDFRKVKLNATKLFNRLLEKTNEIMAGQEQQVSFKFSGIAHGWGGLFYVLLKWYKYKKEIPPLWLKDTLDSLIENQAITSDSLTVWPMRSIDAPGYSTNASNYSSLWCNGNSGLIYLLCMANDVFGEDHYLQLAITSANYVIENQTITGFDLCCGLTGSTYAVLNLLKHLEQKDPKLVFFCCKAVIEIQDNLESLRNLGIVKGRLGPLLLLHQLSTGIEYVKLPLFE